MKVRVNPIFRVSFGLLMLTLSILLAGDWLGLVPHASEIQIENRKKSNWARHYLVTKAKSVVAAHEAATNGGHDGE